MGTQTNTTTLAKRRIAVRRAVLGALVILCLGLFSVYFRESERGPLHAVQSGVGSLVAPIASVTDRAVQPVRDAWDWISDLADARSRAKRLEKQNAALQAAIVNDASLKEQLSRLQQASGFPDLLATGYRRVPATVLVRSPSNLYGRARLDVGTADGVGSNSIVVTGDGGRGALVGYIIQARPDSSVVSFITDPRAAVGVRVLGSGNAPAILQSGYRGQLSLSNLPRDVPLHRGAAVETAGFNRPGLPSVYPPGIPVGQVVEFGSLESDVYQHVQVRPFVNVPFLSEMVVLVPVSPAAKRRASGA